MTATALVFQNTTFDIVDRNGQPWLRLPQIEGALGYANGGKAVSELYRRNADEFTDSMTAVVKLPTAGGEQDTRIFSLRGAHLLAMLSRTRVAKAFRSWVLDILDRETGRQTPPLPSPAFDPRQALQAIRDQLDALSTPQRPEPRAQLCALSETINDLGLWYLIGKAEEVAKEYPRQAGRSALVNALRD